MNDAPGTAQDPPVRVTLPDRWDARIRSFSLDARARAFREQLGLPTDRPIVMTGHQPIIWHAGILAKYLAADALAQKLNGAQGRLLIDHDDDDPFAFRVPVLDDQGITREHTINLAHNRRDGQPIRSRPAAEISAVPDLFIALPSAAEGAERIRDAMAAHEDESSAAAQTARARDDLLAPLTSDAPSCPVMATDLSRTDLYTELVRRMLDDPCAMAEAYNRAAAAFPDANIKPLSIAVDRTELPLWHLAPDGLTRIHVWSDNMSRIEHTTAKALFMTGLFRLAGCDLFIHGTGGLIYDRVTEHWFKDWLGDAEGGLAPMIGVTADLYLPLPFADFTASSAARAKWLAHSVPHNPALNDDDAHAARKAELLEQIDAAEWGSPRRKAIYRELHALLDAYHASHAASLDALDAAAARTDDLIRACELARDRTWPFPLHSDEALSSLRDRVRDSLKH